MEHSSRLRLPRRDAVRTDMTWRPWSAVEDLFAGPADTTREHDLTLLDRARTDDDPHGAGAPGGSPQTASPGVG